jgi:hypothetical protein
MTVPQPSFGPNGPHDSDFQTAIGGYPRTAIVVVSGKRWVSLADNNMVVPGGDSDNWSELSE